MASFSSHVHIIAYLKRDVFCVYRAGEFTPASLSYFTRRNSFFTRTRIYSFGTPSNTVPPRRRPHTRRHVYIRARARSHSLSSKTIFKIRDNIITSAVKINATHNISILVENVQRTVHRRRYNVLNFELTDDAAVPAPGKRVLSVRLPRKMV